MGGFKRQQIIDGDRKTQPAVLGDLMAGELDVFCWCNRCGHNAVISTAVLVRQLGTAVAVPEVGAHMRCTGCGGRDIATRPAWPAPEPVARHG